jgi:hypothetical protein
MDAVFQIRSTPSNSRRYPEQKDCFWIAPDRCGGLLSVGHRRCIAALIPGFHSRYFSFDPLRHNTGKLLTPRLRSINGCETYRGQRADTIAPSSN